jgi:Arc/MetJ family transcription regulator
MKKKSFIETLKKRKVVAIVSAVLIAAVGFGAWEIYDIQRAIDMASHVDPELETSLTEDSAPLASAPKSTVKTTKSSKTTKKNVTLKKAATKTYTSKLPNKTKKTTKTVQQNPSTTVKTDTTVLTQTTEKYTKKSKKKAVTTKVTTTVKTTTTVKPVEQAATKSTMTLSEAAPKLNSKIAHAWNSAKCTFTIQIDPSVSYSGYFNARDKKITLKKIDDCIYHELGHFLAYMAGNYDTGSKFAAVYEAEKGKYTGYNKAYVNQNAAEYFAESVRDYTLDPAGLKVQRPQTYAAIEEAINKLTDTQIYKMTMFL